MTLQSNVFNGTIWTIWHFYNHDVRELKEWNLYKYKEINLHQLGIWTNTVFALWTNKFCNLNKYILQFVQIQSNRSSSERGIIFFFDLFNLDFLSSSSPKPLKRSSSSPLHCCSSQALSSPLHSSPSLWVSNNSRCSFWMPLRLDYIQV